MVCCVCGKAIPKSPHKSWPQYLKRKYCSRACGGKSKQNGEIRHCASCGNEFYAPAGRMKDNAQCCSISCSKRGSTPWNKGRRGAQKAWNKGIPSAPDAIEKMRLSKIGTPAWNKGIPSGMVPPNAFLRGDRHPCWLGGISDEGYSPDFTNRLKRQIRERDGHMCQVCHNEKGRGQLAVHHIDYDKKNNDPANLITLCPSCHAKTNSNRKYWQYKFESENWGHPQLGDAHVAFELCANQLSQRV